MMLEKDANENGYLNLCKNSGISRARPLPAYLALFLYLETMKP